VVTRGHVFLGQQRHGNNNSPKVAATAFSAILVHYMDSTGTTTKVLELLIAIST